MDGIKSKLGAMFLAGALASGCVGIKLREGELEKAQELERYGIRRDERELVSPNLWAANLFIVPMGTATMVTKNDEFNKYYFPNSENMRMTNDEYGRGHSASFLNLVLWPISLAWSIPDCREGAKTLNTKNTVRHYSSTLEGISELGTRKLGRVKNQVGDYSRSFE